VVVAGVELFIGRFNFITMPFSLEQRYLILTQLNNALLRTEQIKAQYENYDGDFWRFNAVLSPTEYQANRPIPLMFQKEDIWQRLDKIEAESEFLVNQVLEVTIALQNLEKAIASERSSPNSALIKADVLQWDAGSRASGMLTQREEYIEQLRYHLGLPPTARISGGARLERS
jgi:hypothetical protein